MVGGKPTCPSGGRKGQQFANGGLAARGGRAQDRRCGIGFGRTGLGYTANARARVMFATFLDTAILEIPRMEILRGERKFKLALGADHTEVSMGGHLEDRPFLKPQDWDLRALRGNRYWRDANPKNPPRKSGYSTERAGSPTTLHGG